MGNQVVMPDKTITDIVLNKVRSLEGEGSLKLPPNYSAGNALKSAYPNLQEIANKAGECALVYCSKASIINSLFDMVVQGLNPAKKQGYFIMYDKKLQFQRSYMGTIAVARRHGVVSTRANAIYKDDEFDFEIDPMTGDRKIVKHKQSLTSLNGEIIGAYAILTLEGGDKYIEIMSIQQIKNCWGRGTNKGNTMAHKDHPEEMCKKTVITRACKLFINTSDDAGLFINDNNDEFDSKDYVKLEIEEEANQGEIVDFNEPKHIENPETETSYTNTEQEAQEALQQQLALENFDTAAGF